MAQITTWDDLESIDGVVLFILNGQNVSDPGAAAAWDEITRRTAVDSVRIVADRAWSDWINERQIPPELVRFCADRGGSPLEINYFLEQGDTLRWVEQSGIRMIVGSLPHNLYNEEVQHVFERRAALLVGGHGRLLAHTLPHRYVYLFDLTDLLERMGRDTKVAAYDISVRTLVDNLHDFWLKHNRPHTADGSGAHSDVLRIVSSHLGDPILDYNEESQIPLVSPSPTFAIGECLVELRAAYLRLAEDYAGRWDAAAIKEDALDMLRQLSKPAE